MLNIYEYIDYRKFLKSFYSLKKVSNPTYSYTTFANNAGISSRGLVKLIIDGKRNLSLKTIPKIIKGLELNKSESKYFFSLVRFNQANNVEEKNDLYQHLLTFKGKQKVHVLAMEQYKLYSKWYYSAIYELWCLKDCPIRGDILFTYISKKLFGNVSIKQAKDAIIDLEKLGLIKEVNGKLISQHAELINPGGEINFAAQSFQKKMIEKSLLSLERPLDQRNISGVTLAIKEEDVKTAQKYIDDFRDKFCFDFSLNKNSDYVYQLNIQFYELTDRNFIFTENLKHDAESLNSKIQEQIETTN